MSACVKSDTIFALSTPLGKSGVAVIRITGPNSFQAFKHFQITKNVRPRVATLVTLYDNQLQVIDECLALYFINPFSFTGEDMVELQIHGSKAVIEVVICSLSKIFRAADPGEFSMRAFLNGKIDLTRAEAIADLIDAETQMQARQALKQMNGSLTNLYNGWRKQIIDLQAIIEAYIDFPDELESSVFSDLLADLSSLVASFIAHLDDKNCGERLRSGLRIVILGQPNAGKSTLLNYLAKRDVAIVSETAGTTRDVIEAHLDLDGYPVTVIDTAGLHDSSLDAIEIEGIRRAKLQAEQADLKVVLFPFSNMADSFDSEIIKLLDDDSICVLSKADNLQNYQPIVKMGREFMPISVHRNRGLENFLERMRILTHSSLSTGDDPIITRQRHRYHMLRATEHLQQIDFIQMPLEIVAEELRLAATEIGKITGVITVDDILDQIFSKFCLGK